MDIDISGLKFDELNELREKIDARVQQMREESAPALVEKFGQEAAALGLSIDELVRAAQKQRRANGRKKRVQHQEGARA